MDKEPHAMPDNPPKPDPYLYDEGNPGRPHSEGGSMSPEDYDRGQRAFAAAAEYRDALSKLPNEGHGWVFPRRDGAQAKCGGPAICDECQADWEKAHGRPHRNAKQSEATPEASKITFPRVVSYTFEFRMTAHLEDGQNAAIHKTGLRLGTFAPLDGMRQQIESAYTGIQEALKK